LQVILFPVVLPRLSSGFDLDTYICRSDILRMVLWFVL
jgi:hypothetical protein